MSSAASLRKTRGHLHKPVGQDHLRWRSHLMEEEQHRESTRWEQARQVQERGGQELYPSRLGSEGGGCGLGHLGGGRSGGSC